MSSVSTYENPVVRDGQSQSGRNLPALSPDYVKIDERERDDLIRFAREFSQLIQYYDDNNHRSGDWGEFFKEGTSADQPHYALFLAFTWLFRFLQKDLNGLTQRHLDHYYKEILQLKHKPARADSVHLLFDLAKNIDQHLLEKGTLLKAGKDALGKDLFYAIDKEILLNKAKVSSLKTVFAQPLYASEKLTGLNSYGLYAAPVANSSDGLGADEDVEGLSWKLFGESQSGAQSTMDKAEVGFAIASPILLLKEGSRKITLNIISTTTIFNDFVPYLIAESLGSDAFSKNEIDNLQSLFSHVNYPGDLSKEQSEVLTKLSKLINHLLTKEIIAEKQQLELDKSAGQTTDSTRFNKLNDWYTTAHQSKVEDLQANAETPALSLTDAQHFEAVKEAMEFYCNEALKEAFLISLSGEEKWIGTLTIDGKCEHSRSLVMEIDLEIDDPAIQAYDEKSLEAGFNTTAPLMKVVLNKADKNRYSFLSQIRPLELNLRVDVVGVRNLVLQNDTASINANKAFMPFGPQPTLDSNFYIGSEEVFQKALNSVSLHFDWADLPDDFADYYKVYSLDHDKSLSAQFLTLEQSIQTLTKSLETAQENAEKEEKEDPKKSQAITKLKEQLAELEKKREKLTDQLAIDRGVFKGKIDLLQNGRWEELYEGPGGKGISLFPNVGNRKTMSITLTDDQQEKFPRPDEFKSVKQLDNSTLYGFARLSLSGPGLGKFKAFGHQRYAQLYTEKIIEKMGENGDLVELPNEAYTPTVAGLSLDYSSKLKINFNTGKEAQEQIFHLHPFGLSEPDLYDNTNQTSTSLIPIYENEGTLFIGLENLEAPQNVSILFQLNEKSVDHEFVGKVEVEWSYLSQDKWVAFDTEEILEDSTEVFTQSGIVTFQIPKGITANNRLLPSGKYWLKASVADNTQGVADALKVAAQGITASFVDFENDPNHLATPLGASSIKKLKISDSAVKSITQGYPSFGGQLAEENQTFYTRVSERLRHKRRAISIWDYEHLVLEAFPTVYKVKCLNHYDPEQTDCRKEMSPGAVTLIILSKGEEETEITRKLAPVTNVITLNEIKNYLKEVSPVFVNARNKLFVKNPSYTRVKVDCHVKFTAGIDQNHYKGQLINDLMKFLSPWAFDTNRPITFERKLYKSIIINHIEELSYVNFVCCFKVLTYDGDNRETEIEGKIIEAAGPADILISYDKHEILPIAGDVCDCNKQTTPDTPVTITHGIGAMIIETDFIVAKNQEQS